MQILNSSGEPLNCDEETNRMYRDEEEVSYWCDCNESEKVKLDAGAYNFLVRSTGKYVTGYYKLKLK